MKYCGALALALSAYVFHASAHVTHEPLELFEKWIKIQHTISDRNLNDLSSTLDDGYLSRFRKNYQEAIPTLQSLASLLNTTTGGAINADGHMLCPPLNDAMKERLSFFFSAWEEQPARMVDYLRSINFTDPTETTDKTGNFNITVEKYKALTKLFISAPSDRQEEECSIALANRLAEYCYSNETFPHYQRTLLNAQDHSIARMLHTILWYNLIGNGWKLWHENCLQSLKQEADKGKRIKYIAGGNDIYTLLSRGIYNITVIDPFLPSQARYYANGWEWLLSGSIGDEIIGMFGTQELKMVRTEFSEQDPFIAKTGGQFQALKKLRTTWTVSDAPSSKALGTVVFERRFASRTDLVPSADHVFLMSYDEFIYLGLPSLLDGWNITPGSLSPDFTCYIKQLRKPANRDFLNNLRIASMNNYADLKFINLASDPN